MDDSNPLKKAELKTPFFEKDFRAFFLVIFTGRRMFIPILSAYYLTLPSATAQEIGFYTAAGYLASFLFNVPAGMFADRFGYKRTIVFTKFLLIASSASFLFAGSFWGFLMGAVFNALGADAFSSGTGSSYFRDLLAEMGRKGEYKKILSAIKADVSLLSVGLIIWLPFLTEYDIRFPFLVALAFDVLGLFAAFSLHSPKKEGGEILKHETKSLLTLFRELRGTPFLPLAVFTAVLGGCLVGEAAFRVPYLLSLGYPLVFAGATMGLSRFVWYLVGRNIATIEKILTPDRLLMFDIAVFSGLYLVMTVFSNPYVIALGIIIGIGYFHGRTEMYNDLLFEHMKDPRYKATVISAKAQLANVFQVVVALWAGMIMNVSYRLGFAVIGIFVFTSLSTIYWFFLRGKMGGALREG